MKEAVKGKELSVQGIFGIPDDIDYSDDDLKLIMNKSIYKFHAIAGQIPDLPEEFSLLLTKTDIANNQFDTVMAAWIQASPEDAYISNFDGFITAYDLKVVDYLTPDQFDEKKVFHPFTNSEVTESIKIKVTS